MPKRSNLKIKQHPSMGTVPAKSQPTKHVTKTNPHDDATRKRDPEQGMDHEREVDDGARHRETNHPPLVGKRRPPTFLFPVVVGGGGGDPLTEGEGPVRDGLVARSASPSSGRECFSADDDDDDENDDDNEEEVEEVPLFDSRFDTSDARLPLIQGVGWGVDYLESRRERKERRERRKDDELDEREALDLDLDYENENENENENAHDDDDDDNDGFDDVDFESYRGRSFIREICGRSFNTRRRHRRRRRDDPPNECWSNFLAFLILSLLAFAIVYESRDRHSSVEQFLPWKSFRRHHRIRHPDHNATDNVNRRHEPNDANHSTHTVDNHKTTSTKEDNGMPLTPAQQTLKNQREWEEYEMEVAQLLADSRPGWDVRSKHGGAVPVENTRDGNSDTNTNTESKTDNRSGRNDGFEHHWVQYYDKHSREHYYYHVETNTTQWQRPPLVQGVVLLGFDAGSGKEYVIEKFEERDPAVEEPDHELNHHSDGILEGKTNRTIENDNTSETKDKEEVVEDVDFYGHHGEDDEAASSFDAEKVLAKYKDSYWRWNHPFRHQAEVKDLFGPVDTPVFWRVPLSAATTVEQIMTHCYKMVVAGTTGSSDDGKVVLSKNVSDHLTIYTLENGAHYLNVDITTPEKIERAKDLGLASSGVADVILTRYLYHAADLFENTARTGRCFTVLRHPVERAVAMFHTLRTKGKLGNMTLEEYADSEAEDNWMTRMITNQMEGALTHKHFDVAREVFGRKCLVGLTSKMDESIHRFARFFKWDIDESIRSDGGGRPKATQKPEEKHSCSKKLAEDGVNVHNYPQKALSKDSTVWKKLARRNKYDIELYEYAEAMYYQQHVVYEQAGR